VARTLLVSPYGGMCFQIHIRKDCYMPLKEKTEERKRLKTYQVKIHEYLKNNVQLDYITDEVDRDYWKLQVRANKLFRDNKCFVCEQDIDWQSNYSMKYGRIVNLKDTRTLIRDHWISVCMNCLRDKYIRKMLDGKKAIY
jgi:hypothetical protein